MKKVIISVFTVIAFIAVGVFVVSKTNQETNAANFSQFKAGNIMSDYVMSNKNSMSKSDISNFIRSKITCNQPYNSTVQYWANQGYKYHIKNGYVVCIADEYEWFGNKTAADVIYKASQDYSINPQVLLVLIQKEQGLLSDKWPNSKQYASATGYGCPDTAACNTAYSGFEKQVRSAAALYREVLNGGWTNYPVGWNYIQYNPTKSCGGSNVYIENRATSALYRFTPYQPNKATLSVPMGATASCGAYGNKNFYGYFTDWFGSTQKEIFSKMDIPRKLIAKEKINKINPLTGKKIDNQVVQKGQIVYFTSKAYAPGSNNKLCLRTKANTSTKSNMCILHSNLQEGPSFTKISTKTYIAKTTINKIDPIDNTAYSNQTIKKGQEVRFSSKTTTRADGKECYRTEANTKSGLPMCVLKTSLTEIKWENITSTLFSINEIVNKIDPFDGSKISSQVIQKGQTVYFNSKTTVNGKECYRTEANTSTGSRMCILSDYITIIDSSSFDNMTTPRGLKTKVIAYKIDPRTGQKREKLPTVGQKINFSQKTYYNNKLCLRTKIDTSLNKNMCVLYENLNEY